MPIPVELGYGISYTSTFSTNITLNGDSDNITVTADINSAVAESDETNNSRTNVWPPTEVRINAPATVVPGSRFTATVDISYVGSFDAANYDISFNPGILTVENVTAGKIGGAVIPVDIWNQRSPGVYTIVQNIPGVGGAIGSGNLVVLHFLAIGSLGQSSNITLSNGVLSHILAKGISATWIGDLVEVSVVQGDANGDGVVNSLDITRVERIIAGLEAPYAGADANLDGYINAIDITKVERIIAGGLNY